MGTTRVPIFPLKSSEHQYTNFASSQFTSAIQSSLNINFQLFTTPTVITIKETTSTATTLITVTATTIKKSELETVKSSVQTLTTIIAVASSGQFQFQSSTNKPTTTTANLSTGLIYFYL